MTGLEAALALSRALIYLGSIAAAGGVLFTLSFPRAALAAAPALTRQIAFGGLLLLAAEPLRYVLVQLSMAQGDLTLAFGPDLRWTGLELPGGHAAALRLAAAGFILAARPWQLLLRAPAALVLVASFLFEGHSNSTEAPTLLARTLLFLHVAAAHWWLGALYPLLDLAREGREAVLPGAVESFSRPAVWIVAGLFAAGGLLFLLLTGASLRLESLYQQRFLAKLALALAVVGFAAWNKFRLVPLLARKPSLGALRLQASIRGEMAAALLVLAATAWATSTGPDE